MWRLRGVLSKMTKRRYSSRWTQHSQAYTMAMSRCMRCGHSPLEIKKKGEFVPIMGASGFGKSTTMNIIGCLDGQRRPLFSRCDDLSQLSKDQRADIRNKKLGFVFQGFNLLSRTSALENDRTANALPPAWTLLNPSPSLAHWRRSAWRREKNHPNQYTGGQQQRVAIARSLVNDPALILADEPTGNLTRALGRSHGNFSAANRERGMTLILVTHEPDIADYADRLVTFKDGR